MELPHFNLFDIAIAYRKVKVDLFMSGTPCKEMLADFEDNLNDNLMEILDALNSFDRKKIINWCGGYCLCPKKIKLATSDSGVIFSDPENATLDRKIEKCELRVLVNTPVAFHIITTLWINKVGEKLERSLSNNSYGNKLRRKKCGDLNLNSIGTFNYYLSSYQKWRDNGLRVMRESIEKQKNIIAITADFSAFYHNIDPRFLLDEKFQKELDHTPFDNKEKNFTELIVQMIRYWANNTPLKKGLPVGASISAVIANLILVHLDKNIEKELVPLYYGRYVDDIIIVVENTNKFATQNDVWEWITDRVKCLKRIDQKIEFSQEYLQEKNFSSKLYFEQDKTKIFILGYPTGIAMIDSLEYQIKKNSSEWRSFPDLPQDSKIAAMLLSTCSKSGEDADNLRKTDSLSIRRALFAMKLRDFEAYCRNLDADCWKLQRKTFLDTIEKHFTNIESFFELFRYFPRIMSIATECEEYEAIVSIISKINKFYDIMKVVDVSIAGQAKKSPHSHYIDDLRKYVNLNLRESIIIALTKNPNSEVMNKLKVFFDIGNNPLEKQLKLMSCDLAYKPFRAMFLPKQMYWDHHNSTVAEKFVFSKKPIFTHKKTFDTFKKLSNLTKLKQLKDTVPISWLFPTRPFSMMELYFIIPDAFNSKLIAEIMQFSRGYSGDVDAMPKNEKWRKNENSKYINIPMLRHGENKLSIAVTSWKTEEDSWRASACKKRDPDQNRYARLMHLLNHIMKTHSKLDYVIFPELSIPPRWFLGIARKLKTSGISLISGVEYIHNSSSNEVYNQVWCSLLHNGLGFYETAILKHDKEIPAIHEKHDLDTHSGKRIKAEKEGSAYNIVKHGDFFFGILICNELTNINYRAQFRGKVDAIFVPEWNKDVDMFGSLVESAAYDIHAYVIQCNNRAYGDTRIRVPSKDNFRRDIVKIKGGEEDYFVVGKIDISSLRKFQTHSNHPIGENVSFKPMPCGYEICEERKLLPD